MAQGCHQAQHPLCTAKQHEHLGTALPVILCFLSAFWHDSNEEYRLSATTEAAATQGAGITDRAAPGAEVKGHAAAAPGDEGLCLHLAGHAAGGCTAATVRHCALEGDQVCMLQALQQAGGGQLSALLHRKEVNWLPCLSGYALSVLLREGSPPRCHLSPRQGIWSL